MEQLFEPFCGLRYADATALAGRLAPPYDVITPERRRELAARDQANIVHLDLPVAPPGADPYHAAAELLGTWRRAKLIERDARPGAYVLRTTTTFEDGRTRCRTGVFLAVAALPFAPGSYVRPHERTHAGPKEDRRRLTLATGCNLSPVFLLTPDSRGDLATALAESARARPWAVADVDGAVHEVWLLAEPAARRLADLASDEPAYIADGHHRYETAVFVSEEIQGPWKAGAQRTLAHVVSFQDPGLEILPTHRLVQGRMLERHEVLQAANPLFARALPGQQPHLTVAFADGGEAPMVLREGADTTRARDLPAQEVLRSLAVAICDYLFVRVVLAGLLGGPPPLEYTPLASEARAAVAARRAGLAVLLPPTRLAEVRAVSDAGLFMPPKSTFFAPKVPTGVVMRTFEPEP